MQIPNPPSFQPVFRRSLLAIALAAAGSAAQANDWIGGIGDWSNAANWSAGVPVFGDTVFIDNGNQAASAVALDVTASLSALTIDAGDELSHNNGSDLNLTGGVTNNGSWRMNGTSADTFVQVLGNQTLGGNGELVMGDDPQNRLISNNAKIINGADHTIRGGGQLLNNTGGMQNDGTILAEGAAATVIDPNGVGFTNNGALSAIGAGGLALLNGTFVNNTTIDAQNGSRIAISGSVVTGGSLATSGTGVVDLESSSTLSGVTLGNGSAVRQTDGQDVFITDGITNNGSWAMNGTSADTFIQFNGDQTLGGSGEIVMGNDPQNRIVTNNTVLSNGVNHTIRGGGLLLNNTGGMINQGRIIADSNTQLVQIDANGLGFRNSAGGRLRAVGDAGIEILTGGFVNEGDVFISANSQISRTGDYTQAAGLTRVDGILMLTQPTFTIVDIQGGFLDGDGLIEGDVSNAGGIIGAGQAVGEAGSLVIDGTFMQSNTASMLVEIGGSEQGVTYDLISALDDANLGGTLEVSLLGGFAPSMGETFDILTAVTVTGEFDNLIFPVFDDRTFDILYLGDRVRLTTTVVPLPAAVWLFGAAVLGLAGFARRRAA
jgi:hypothetical protein